MARKPKSVSELYQLHESLQEQAKALYDQKDAILAKLVRAWRKDKAARIDEKFVLDIEDTWRGKLKAFAPAFSHRYKLKLNPAQETD